MNDRKDLIERKERTILDNSPSDETALKMAEFFMRTSVPRILAVMKATEEAKKKGDKKEVM
ncbi:hypothetical protein ACSYR0_02420 (plasmid) [Bacillus cereus]|uniref:hypothetical protein n=1 Tax=Bacillus cereus TaxID=1396 RepID=UPI0001A0D900|nr:hypothetical protein [Bacillus cereus]EEL61564.1 hypothetical protein bcere0025_57560 [Bacillus cereus F65185]EKS7870164.1 hypothetical protein [Bacillus cereus]PFI73652.1 hypothetical protein COI85_18095 [Bacillus cereus]PFJ60721.1 hypothetical protein COI94_29200 [Bacillus cereus]PFN40958.1 hypothetical protein COJ57_04790 [Bacillus cereus]